MRVVMRTLKGFHETNSHFSLTECLKRRTGVRRVNRKALGTPLSKSPG